MEAIKYEYEQAAKKYGEVSLGNITVALTQDAYCDNYGTDGDVRYYADAIDTAHNPYRVSWDTVEGWSNHIIGTDGDCIVEDCRGWCEDESNACDWDSPVLIEEA